MTTWAHTGDTRLLAYENAVVLADMLNEALTTYKVEERSGRAPDLDEFGWVIESASPKMLGALGKRLDDGRVAFTYAQVIDMAGLLGTLLPTLAEEAHAARQEAAARRN